MKQALQVGDPKGRLDLLAVRLIEAAIKARFGASPEARLSVDLLDVGETVSRRVGFSGFASLRPRLVELAKQYGVETDQTLPQLAESLGLLKARRAGRKRRNPCTR